MVIAVLLASAVSESFDRGIKRRSAQLSHHQPITNYVVGTEVKLRPTIGPQEPDSPDAGSPTFTFNTPDGGGSSFLPSFGDPILPPAPGTATGFPPVPSLILTGSGTPTSSASPPSPISVFSGFPAAATQAPATPNLSGASPSPPEAVTTPVPTPVPSPFAGPSPSVAPFPPSPPAAPPQPSVAAFPAVTPPQPPATPLPVATVTAAPPSPSTPPPPPTASPTQVSAVSTPGPGDGAGGPQACHIRRCDQTITGRNLPYSRALEIVQDEEYLNEADFDVIKRKRSKRSLVIDCLESSMPQVMETVPNIVMQNIVNEMVPTFPQFKVKLLDRSIVRQII